MGEDKFWSFVNSKGMMANSSIGNYWRTHFLQWGVWLGKHIGLFRHLKLTSIPLILGYGCWILYQDRKVSHCCEDVFSVHSPPVDDQLIFSGDLQGWNLWGCVVMSRALCPYQADLILCNVTCQVLDSDLLFISAFFYWGVFSPLAQGHFQGNGTHPVLYR